MMRETLSDVMAPIRHGLGRQRDAPGVVAPLPEYLHYYDEAPRPRWWRPALRWFNAIGGDVLFLAALAVAVALICTTPVATG